MEKSPYTAAVLIIGNEILSGRTLDSNGNYLAKQLVALGINLEEIRSIPDRTETIISHINELRKKVTYVFTTGGIGPTHDDITSEAVAQAFGVSLICHPEAYLRLEKHYGKDDLNEARIKMAYVPSGAQLIDNPISAAPGFNLENVYVFAGVPKIMQAMFDFIKPMLKGGTPVESKTVELMVTEGTIAASLSDIQSQFPDVEIGSYPFIHQGKLGTALVARSNDSTRLNQAHLALMQLATQCK
ncbi:MAG: competence/damage-inducible protein A [Alphaproteobacteria bacterium]|nr:competence/damage-inducible protein A [Alphaproteobacteria bacterium]